VNAPAAQSALRLQALQGGDPAAFDAVFADWRRPLFAFAWRYLHNAADAEDLVLETFVRLHRRRAALRPDTNLSAWLFTTLANLCHNHHRWRRRHPEVSLDTPADPTDIARSTTPSSEAPIGGGLLEHDEAVLALRTAIDRLPHDQRTVVLLHHYEYLSYREIAAIVGCSERGVETRLYRARQNLRTSLATFLGAPSSRETAPPH
jgi:RNA polymerase sigma factor (sigma-70 family)